MQGYSKEIEIQMKAFYDSLSEKDRRRYAAIEVQKLEYGGMSYIERVLGCDRNTIIRGIGELNDREALEQKKIREEGGGRKSAIETIPGIEEVFMKVIENNTAGSPTTSNKK